MGTLYIPTEIDFKRWIKEAVEECLQNSLHGTSPDQNNEDDLLDRKEIAKILRISLVTLTDWVKRGLPSHKQRGRVYFIHSEVMDYIKKNRLKHYLKSA
jgi:hypothetical protein